MYTGVQNKLHPVVRSLNLNHIEYLWYELKIDVRAGIQAAKSLKVHNYPGRVGR